MGMAYSKANAAKVEDLLLEAGYHLRVGKGTFRSNFCLVKGSPIILINGFLKGEARFFALLDLVRQLPIEAAALTEPGKALFSKIKG